MPPPVLPPPTTGSPWETEAHQVPVPSEGYGAQPGPPARSWLPGFLRATPEMLERQAQRVPAPAGTYNPQMDEQPGDAAEGSGGLAQPQFPEQLVPGRRPVLVAPPMAPAEALHQAVQNLQAIAFALDPGASGALGMGVSTARTASSAGPQRIPLALASQLVLTQNRNRRGLTIFHENAAGVSLFVCYGSIASPLQYTVNIPGGGLYEMPPVPLYIGEISLACSAATGAALITELE